MNFLFTLLLTVDLPRTSKQPPSRCLESIIQEPSLSDNSHPQRIKVTPLTTTNTSELVSALTYASRPRRRRQFSPPLFRGAAVGKWTRRRVLFAAQYVVGVPVLISARGAIITAVLGSNDTPKYQNRLENNRAQK